MEEIHVLPVSQFLLFMIPMLYTQKASVGSMYSGCDYRMAGNFRGVLIFVIFVVDLAVTKISTHEN